MRGKSVREESPVKPGWEIDLTSSGGAGAAAIAGGDSSNRNTLWNCSGTRAKIAYFETQRWIDSACASVYAFYKPLRVGSKCSSSL
jgi:hypothetical protein